MEDDNTGVPPERPDSLLPYDLWTEDALRQVVVSAITYVAKNGLPGEHHFYISFRTGARGVMVPQRLIAQYPHEMTIVVQHQYWDLKVDDADESFSVGLTFGGIPATLVVPFAAITEFADPHVQFGLHFRPPSEDAANDGAPEPATTDADTRAEPDVPSNPAVEIESRAQPEAEPQVVSLDAFRKRSPQRDSEKDS